MPSLNHNETLAANDKAEALADLPVSDEQAKEIKGGPFYNALTNVETTIRVTDT